MPCLNQSARHRSTHANTAARNSGDPAAFSTQRRSIFRTAILWVNGVSRHRLNSGLSSALALATELPSIHTVNVTGPDHGFSYLRSNWKVPVPAVSFFISAVSSLRPDGVSLDTTSRFPAQSARSARMPGPPVGLVRNDSAFTTPPYGPHAASSDSKKVVLPVSPLLSSYRFKNALEDVVPVSDSYAARPRNGSLPSSGRTNRSSTSSHRASVASGSYSTGAIIVIRSSGSCG